jgi:hypothetical protein
MAHGGGMAAMVFGITPEDMAQPVMLSPSWERWSPEGRPGNYSGLFALEAASRRIRGISQSSTPRSASRTGQIGGRSRETWLSRGA